MKIDLPLRFDAEFGDTIVEVKRGLRSARSLRGILVQLAYYLQETSEKRALLALPNTAISPGRLTAEWHLAASTFRPEIASRMSIAWSKGEEIHGIPNEPEAHLLEHLKELLRDHAAREENNLLRPDYHHEILKFLLLRWFLKEGPVTAVELGNKVGCSYPTVAGALERLRPFLRPRVDRSIELDRFPHEPWIRLLATQEQSRHTLRFTDRSGSPRLPETLLTRLAKLSRTDIAAGGVTGARSHDPDLDLVGTPRLDLTVHSPEGRPDLAFVNQLDPGLATTLDPNQPAVLVVHFLRRGDSGFTRGEDNILRADPVECLLDLHEARLETEAGQFLSFLLNRNRSSYGKRLA